MVKTTVSSKGFLCNDNKQRLNDGEYRCLAILALDMANGQPYVVVSRVGSENRLKFAIKKIDDQPPNITSNVVFKEVFIS